MKSKGHLRLVSLQPDYAPTKLHDGREVASDSEEWKMECLAKYVLTLGTRGQMERWLVAFAQRHGAEAKVVLDLRERMNAIRLARGMPDANGQPERQEASPRAAETDPK